MKKDRFYKLLENPGQASSVDIKALEKLIESSPYFATARTLHAKIQIERKNITAEEELEKRGSFFPNSLILSDWEEETIPKKEEKVEANETEKVDVTKEIIEALPKAEKSEPLGHTEEAEKEKPVESVKLESEPPEVEEPSKPEEKKREEETPEIGDLKIEKVEKGIDDRADTKAPTEEEEKKSEPETKVEEKEDESEPSGDIVDQVMENMLALRKTLSEMERKGQKPAKKTTSTKSSSGKASTKKTTAKTKKPPSSGQAKPTGEKPAQRSTGTKAGTSDSKKKTEKPEKPEIAKKDKEREKKLEKQRTLIKDFIKNPPELKQEYKGDGGPNEDLSNVSTSENRLLVSESLAKILTRQGKHQKAKEVYEQLMLKYPKKKSYFAAQIKSLKV